MKRVFVSNLILLLAVNLLVKPFYILGIETEVQNRVGAEAYGSYFALISFSFLLNILLDLGITNYNTREIAQHRQLLRKHFGGIVVLRVLLMGLYGLILLGAGLFLGYNGEQMYILAILGLNQGLVALILYLRSNLTALHLFRIDSFMSVIDRLILIIMLSVLLWGNITQQAFQIEWFVYAQTAAYGLTALIGFALVLYHTGKIQFRFDRPFIIAILKKSFPYALLVFLMAVYFRTDSVMLERMHPKGAFEAGIYAMGYRFFEAANMIAFLFGTLLLPIFSRMIIKKNDVQPVVSLSFKILLGGAMILSATCFSLPREILELRYHDHNELAAPVFAVLMVGFVFVCCTYIFGTLLTANGSLKRLNRIAVSGVVLNIVLNLILIPDYGAWGCAFASCFTLGVVAMMQMIEAQRIFKFRITRGFRRSFTAFCLLIIALVISAYYIDVDWRIELPVIFFLGLAFSMLTGMLHVGRFWDLVLRRKE